MSNDDLEARRERCGALFNNRYFGEVISAVRAASESDSAALVTTRQIAAHTQLADSLVRAVLVRLVDSRVLTKLPRFGIGRSPQYYRVSQRVALDALDAASHPAAHGSNDDHDVGEADRRFSARPSNS